jgi:Fe-S-cluster containining protein
MNLPVLQPWYADGLKFTCTACGDCCTGGHGFVWLLDAEIDRMAAHLGLSRAGFLKRHCRTVEGKISLNERRNAKGEYDCIFLKPHPDNPAARGCSIYPVRPTQCRTFPFWPENLTSKTAWVRAARGCPGMNRGKSYSRKRIEELRDAEDWPDNPPTSNKSR